MATVYSATTELEAVNIMLGTIGESPVNSLEVSGMADVANAVSILHETSRAIQSEGWNVNSEFEFELTPNNDGHIILPSNVLKIDVSGNYYDWTVDPVVRSGKMYDKKNHTYVFSNAIKFDIVWFLPFADLTESIRRYITIAAARKFQKRFYSSSEIDSFTKEDEMFAKIEALNSDGDVADYNMMDNSDIYNIVMR